jgi:uncharacterized repeat protein (TIGR02543 family)
MEIFYNEIDISFTRGLNVEIIFRAIWIENTYTITFNSNNGESEAFETVYSLSDANRMLSNSTFNYLGYKFIGWSKYGSDTIFEAQQLIDDIMDNNLVSIVDGVSEYSISLYAQWSPITYTVVFQPGANGVAGYMEPLTLTYGVLSELSLNEFERPDYEFTGWATSRIAQSPLYLNGASVLNLKDSDGQSIILYALWNSLSYTLSFNSNSGYGSMSPQSISVTTSGNLKLNTFIKSGYVFDGWGLSPTATDLKISDGASFVSLAGQFTSMTPTIYATWKALTYTINFDPQRSHTGIDMNVVSLDYSSSILENSYSVAGYVFCGWYASYSSIQNSTLILDKATVSSIVNLFNLEDNNDVVRPSITLTASWSPINYYIAFNQNGGTGISTPQVFIYDDATQRLNSNTFIRMGYYFSGWNSQANGEGTDFSDNALIDTNLVAINNDTYTLYAMWAPITYYIVYKLDGGSIANDYTDGVMVELTYSVLYTLLTPEKTGFVFQNWKTGDDTGAYSSPSYYAGSVVNLSDTKDDIVYLWANYFDNSSYHGVMYNSNGGSGHIESDIGSIGSLILLSNGEGFSRSGYLFIGWSTDQSAASADHENYPIHSITDETPNYTITTDLVILYAIWELNTYTISIYTDVVGGSVLTIDVNYSLSYDLSEAITSREGYTHQGFATLDGLFTSFPTYGIYMLTHSLQLQAVWKANTFIVAFEANTGSGSMSVMEGVVYGSNTNLIVNSGQIYKTGYTFVGWNTQADGRGIFYSNGQSAIISTLNNVVITLYAMWNKNTYTVIFNGNTASGTMAAQELTYDTLSNLNSNTFTKTGYQFFQWNSLPNGRGIQYSENEEVSNLRSALNSSYELYAIWSPITYWVSFDKNGAQGTMSDQLFTFDTSDKLSENKYQQTGYTFIGWNSELDGSGISYANEDYILNLSTELNGTYIIYATWSENSYQIAFDPNLGSGDIPIQGPILYTELVNLTQNTFTKTGYGFAGWSYEDQVFSDADLIQYLTPNNETITLFAIWQANTYYVNYYPNNANAGVTTNVVANYDLAFSLPTDLDLQFAKTGYSFLGWNTQSDGFGVGYSSGNLVSNLTASPNGRFNLYAQWTPNTYNVYFVSNGGSGTIAPQYAIYNSIVTLSTNQFIYENYYFTSWNVSSDGSGISYTDNAEFTWSDANNLTLYAQWALITYSVLYDKNALGNVIEGEMASSEHTYGVIKTLTTPSYTRVGYSLIGWSRSSGDQIEAEYSLHYSRSDMTSTHQAVITLFAVWSINTYTITYITQGSISTVPNVLVRYGDSVQPPNILNQTDNIPLRPGYVFLHWSKTQSDVGDVPFEFETPMPANNITLFAKWQASVSRYTITFNANGGQFSLPYITLSYDEDLSVVTNVEDPRREGYNFIGWFRENATDPYQLDKMPAESFELTAKWTEGIYTIRFETYGGGNFPNVIGRFNLNTFDLSTLIPEKEGYEFKGWYADEACTVELDGIQTIDSATPTIYAKWEKVKITITYNSNGGRGLTVTSLSLLPGSDFPKHPELSRDGYVFSGWYLNVETTQKENFTVVPDTDTILYAGWQILPVAKASVPGWAVALIVIVSVLLVGAIVTVIIMSKKREAIWKGR